MDPWIVPIVFSCTAIFVFGIFYALGMAFFSEERRVMKRIETFNQEEMEREFGREARILLKKEQDEHSLLSQIPIFMQLPLLFIQAGMKIGVTEWLTWVGTTAGVLAGAVWIVTQNWLSALAAGVGTIVLAYMYVLQRRKSRVRQFEVNLAQSLEIISRSLRAGHPMHVGLQMVSTEMPDPVGAEFGRIFREQQMGLPIEDSLRALAERIPLVDLRFFVLTVLIHRQTGGDLAEVLDNLSHVIRDRFKVLGQVKALTAEGRLSGWVLSVLPLFVFLLIQLINPGYARLLFTNPLGIKMVYTALGFMALGILCIRKIVAIKV